MVRPADQVAFPQLDANHDELHRFSLITILFFHLICVAEPVKQNERMCVEETSCETLDLP